MTPKAMQHLANILVRGALRGDSTEAMIDEFVRIGIVTSSEVEAVRVAFKKNPIKPDPIHIRNPHVVSRLARTARPMSRFQMEPPTSED